MRFRNKVFIAAMLVVLGVACEKPTEPPTTDNTTPPTPLVVSLKLDSVVAVLNAVDTVPAIRCYFYMTGSATGGKGGQRAPWGAARLLISAGATRTTPIDSINLTAETINAGFGGDLLTGSTGKGVLSLLAPFPYSISADFRYREAPESTTVKTITYQADCGRAPESGEAPALKPRTILPAATARTGDTLSITFGATSPIGVWATWLQVTGPCALPEKIFFDRYSKDVTRTVKLPIPLACPTGTAFTVNASAVDFLIRETEGTGAGPFLDGKRDSVAPKVVEALVRGGDSGGPVNLFLVGDLFRIDVDVTDSGAIGGRPTIGFRLGAGLDKDSVPGTVKEVPPRSGGQMDTLYTRNFQRLVPASWAGDQQVHAFVRDPSNNLKDTVVATPRFLAEVTHPVQSAQLPTYVREWVYDQKRGTIWMIGNYSATHCLIAVNAATLAVQASIPCPTASVSLDITESNDSLVYILAGDDAHVAVRSLLTGDTSRITTGVNPGLLHDLSGVRALAGGQMLVTHTNPSNSGDADGVFTFQVGGGSTDLASSLPPLHAIVAGRSLNHQEAIFGNGSAVRVLHANGTLSPTYNLEFGSLHPWGISGDSTGSAFALYSKVLDNNAASIFTLVAPSNFQYNGNVISPNGQYLYSSHDRGFLRTRLSDGKILENHASPFGAVRITISPDGKTLFALGQDDKIYAVDLAH